MTPQESKYQKHIERLLSKRAYVDGGTSAYTPPTLRATESEKSRASKYNPISSGTTTKKEQELSGMSKGSPVYSDKTTNAIDIERERFESKYGTRRK